MLRLRPIPGLASCLIALASCMAPLSEQRYAQFSARLDALCARVEGWQQEASKRPAGSARDDELAQCQAVLQVLLLAKAGGAVAYLDDDAAALERIEDLVDASLASCPELPED